MNDIEKIINELTLEEKARLLCGYKNMETYPIPRLNIPSLVLSDGPSGIRKEDQSKNSLVGLADSMPSTSFPSSTNLAMTWNKELVYEVGKTIGSECNHFGINVLLGPAVNIKRNPKCGRNFDYYSEDPIHAGYLGAEFVNGLKSKNVATTLKHFACNNTEQYRFIGDSIVDEKALREIYLKPFEIITKKAKPDCIMNAYNKVNGIHCSNNSKLLKDILRDEWGFNGVVMTDWGGIVKRDDALNNGTDLEMPGMNNHNIQLIVDAVKNNTLSKEVLNESVRRILRLINKTKQDKITTNFNENYKVALKTAEESAVLLENDGTLPLNKNQQYLVVGDLFEKLRYQGSGSSLINPYKLSSHESAFRSLNINYQYVKGYTELDVNPNIELMNEALQEAKKADTIIFYGGLTSFDESEGFDRNNLDLPLNQIQLLIELQKLNKKIVLVLFGGGVIDLSFNKNINAILYMGLAGEAIGEATTNLLFGNVSPSGKLSCSWPFIYDDVYLGSSFISSPHEVYKESIYVGYRYFNTFNKSVRYPFGYGLSYSFFEYKDLICEVSSDITLKLYVKNKTNISASSVIQVYSKKTFSKIARPKSELKGFTKVSLKPFEEKEVVIYINKEDLKVYDPVKQAFVLEKGKYILEVAEDANTPVLSTQIELDGITDINTYPLVNNNNEFYDMIGYHPKDISYQKRHYTMETPIIAFETLFGKIFKRIVCNIGLRQYKKALKQKDEKIKERNMKTGYFVYKMMPYNNLRSICFSSSGALSYHMALAILDFVNGHFLKGFIKLFKSDKIKQ